MLGVKPSSDRIGRIRAPAVMLVDLDNLTLRTIAIIAGAAASFLVHQRGTFAKLNSVANTVTVARKRGSCPHSLDPIFFPIATTVLRVILRLDDAQQEMP